MGQGTVTNSERIKGRNEFITRMANEDLMKVIPREAENPEVFVNLNGTMASPVFLGWGAFC
jgi:hypothetical protein